MKIPVTQPFIKLKVYGKNIDLYYNLSLHSISRYIRNITDILLIFVETKGKEVLGLRK